jgi:hypothetical protein
MSPHFLLLFFTFVLTSCAPPVKKEDILIQAKEIKAAVSVNATPIPQASPALQPLTGFLSPEEVSRAIPIMVSPMAAGERLVYKARYFGIPIGEFVIVNTGT